MKKLIYSLAALTLAACSAEKQEPIDRHALVTRNNPSVTAVDSLASLSVGNGEFAFTTDITGLQTFPDVYKNDVNVRHPIGFVLILIVCIWELWDWNWKRVLRLLSCRISSINWICGMER